MSLEATGDAQPSPAAHDDPSSPGGTGGEAGATEAGTAPEPSGPSGSAGPAEEIEAPEPDDIAEPADDAEPGRRGHALLLIGVFVLAAVAIVGGALAVIGSLTHGFKKPVEITYKKSAIFGLRTGECIDPNGQSATIVPCTTAHEAEVFATFQLPASKWPGDAAVRAAASSGCATRLTGYLNPQLAISFSSTYVYPGSVAWQAGTRTVVCEVRATSGQQLTGSVRGASAGVSASPAG